MQVGNVVHSPQILESQEKATTTTKQFNPKCPGDEKLASNHWCPTFGTQNVLIHNDNTSSHNSRAVTQYLEEQHVHILTHPHHAACDFWLSPVLKNKEAAMMFSYAQDLNKAVNSGLVS